MNPLPLLPEEYPDPQVDSDLEWMLQSGQVERALLAEALVKEYYQPVYALALSRLDDPEEASRTALDIFVTALMSTYRYPGGDRVQSWLFALAREKCQGAAQRLTWKRRIQACLPQHGATSFLGASTPSSVIDAALWLAVDSLREQARWVLLLHHLHDWAGTDIARLLQLSESAIDFVLEQASQEIFQAVQQSGLSAQALSPENLEAELRRSLRARWSFGELPAAGLAGVAGEVARQADHQAGRLKKLVFLRETVLVGGAVLLVLGVLWGMNRLSPEPPPTPAASPTLARQLEALKLTYLVQPGDTLESIAANLGVPIETLTRWDRLRPEEEPLPEYLNIQIEPMTVPLPRPTPVRPVAHRLEALTAQSDLEYIRLFLSHSEQLWRSLWLDAHLVYYGPPGYIGPQQVNHIQGWASQPGRRLEIGGPVTGEPEWNILQTNSLVYSIIPQSRTAWVQPYGTYGSGSNLANLIEPLDEEALRRVEDLKAVGEDIVAGRKTVILEWTTSGSGIRMTTPYRLRFWMDALTGVALRGQYYGGQDLQTLITDLQVKKVYFDVEFMDESLFDIRFAPKEEFVQDYGGQPAATGLPPPTPATAPGHTRLAAASPPPGFHPATSALMFQYPEGLSAWEPFDSAGAESSSGQALQVELFAGGYSLGSLPLFHPFSSRCDRSPDGSRVAIYAAESFRFRWFELSEPNELHASLDDEYSLTDFAFAPDNRRLAFSSLSRSGIQHIGILDTDTGESTDLLLANAAESLVWSPDGKFLALLALLASQDEQKREALVINARTGEIVYRTPVDLKAYYSGIGEPADWPAPDWPARAWEVEFPVYRNGVESCTLP